MTYNAPKNTIYWFLRGHKPKSDLAAKRAIKFGGRRKEHAQKSESLWSIEDLMFRADNALLSLSRGHDRSFWKDASDSLRVSYKDWADLRAIGPYIPHESAYGHCDTVNTLHGIPNVIFIGIDQQRFGVEQATGRSRFTYIIARQAQQLPWFIQPQQPGAHYEISILADFGKGTVGMRAFATLVDQGSGIGKVIPCKRLGTAKSALPNGNFLIRRDWVVERLGFDGGASLEEALTLGINFYQTIDYHWYARISDGRGVVQVSITVEEAKELFSDRTTALAKDGRRKRIIHWVRAHRRHTGSNVRTHYRGERDFSMHGKSVQILLPGDHIEARYMMDHEVHFDSSQVPWWAKVSRVAHNRLMAHRAQQHHKVTATNPHTGENFEYEPLPNKR